MVGKVTGVQYGTVVQYGTGTVGKFMVGKFTEGKLTVGKFTGGQTTVGKGPGGKVTGVQYGR